MLLAQFTLAAGLLLAPPTPPQTLTVRAVVEEPRGRVEWFRGTYEELLTEAAKSERVVLLDFYSRSNSYSRKLEKTTYLSSAVLGELSGLLCFGVDADSRDSRALRRKFQVKGTPALVFLDPDGKLRDHLSGYFGPERFVDELRRIKQNQGTFSDLRGRIAAEPADLDTRWELACKLRAIGDLEGHLGEVAQIRERDPAGTSRASLRVRLSELYARAALELDLDPIYKFVEPQQDPLVRFEGWWKIWELEGQAARSARDPELARRHELRYFAVARILWPLVPPEHVGQLGNNIAWSFYESRASATRSDLEFALSVAEKAVAAAPDVPAVVDTLACCLFLLGKHEQALAQVRRCIELDPENAIWRERLAEFERKP